MKIFFCGVGAAINTNRNHSSYLIDSNLLIDAPPQIAIILKQQNKDIHSINTIIITHLHGDHYFGLPFLLIEFLIRKRNAPLIIYGPSETEEKVKELINLAFPELDYSKVVEAAALKYSVVENGYEASVEPELKVNFIAVQHGIETYGITITKNSKKYFFTADTEYFDGMHDVLHSCLYCIADATTVDFKVKGHMTYKDVLELAERHKDVTFFIVHRALFDSQKQVDNICFPMDFDEFSI